MMILNRLSRNRVLMAKPIFFAFIAAVIMLMTTTVDLLAADNGGPKVANFTLKNGMEVVVISDHGAPVVTHMVWYRVGAADEQWGKSGIAHFLEHLMFKGTDKIKPGQFSKIISRLGGEDNAFTSQDATAYFQRVSKDNLAKMMEMEADRMLNLRLSKKDVATERDVVLEERRSRTENSPSAILGEHMSAALYLNHPYRVPIIGWKREIEQLNLDDALAFYKLHYAPNNAILVVAGDVTADEVKKLATRIYGNLTPNKAIKPRKRPLEPPQVAPRTVTYTDPRAGKASIRRQYLVPSYKSAEPGEAEALDLLAKVGLSGATSKLYRKLVVDSKIAASAGGWYESSGMDYGRLAVSAVASEGVSLDEVEAAIDEVLADLRDNPVSEEELQRAKTLYLSDYIFESDSQSQLARRYGWALVVGRTIEDVDNWPKKIAKVTAADIQKVAKKYFDKRRSVTGRLLPSPADAVTDKSGGADDAASGAKPPAKSPAAKKS